MTFTIRHFVDPPERPVLLVALDGWIDAGMAAATASEALIESIPTRTLVTFVIDELMDLRARRPLQQLEDGVRGELGWSEPELLVGEDRNGLGIALLVGPEPDYRWKAFTSEVSALAVEMRARLVVNLGGFPAAAPHTRPIRLAATASDNDLARQIGFVAGALDVPAGIADIIGSRCSEVGIPSIGLWARVPHYVAAMPFAPAALALLEGFAAISGLSFDLEPLRVASEEGRRLVDDLISASEEHVEMVRQLEEQIEEFEGDHNEMIPSMPSGDEIAAELERFLRGETNEP